MQIVCWWSGGITSAVACKKAIDLWGGQCKVVFIGTKNEDDDTYRFLTDCEKWYGLPIETISNKKYASIEDVWYEYKSLNVATGAICSSVLKRQVRLDYQRRNTGCVQVFGFDMDEPNRAKNIKKNYPDCNPVFPLLMYGLHKKDCIKIVEAAGIAVPRAYQLGFSNNNCLNTGCVQGGIGYWKKIKNEFPDKFDKMAAVEHELTEMAGKPVTCLKDQSAAAKASGMFQVFLKPHPDYPNKSIDDMKGHIPENMMECNGFCGVAGSLFEEVGKS